MDQIQKKHLFIFWQRTSRKICTVCLLQRGGERAAVGVRHIARREIERVIVCVGVQILASGRELGVDGPKTQRKNVECTMDEMRAVQGTDIR